MPAGRPRKPSHLKLVSGTHRADRANPAEPKLAAKRPRLPEHLTSYARAAWLRFAPLLDRMGVLTEAESAALERLAECYAEVRTLSDVINTDGTVIRPVLLNREGFPVMDADGMAVLGKPVVHPAVAARANADTRLKGYLSEFGLTPAARSKVKTVAPVAEPAPGSEYF